MTESRPTFGDWLMLGLSVVFCAIGMLLLVVSPKDRAVALMCLLISVPSTIVFGFIIRRRFRRRRFNALLVSVAPGTELRMSVGRSLLLALPFAIFAVAMLTIAPEDLGWGRYAVAAGFLALVAYVLFGVISGQVSRTFMRFESDGLRASQRKIEFLIPWDNITKVVEFEMARNACVGIVLADPGALLLSSEDNRQRLNKFLGDRLGLCGCHLMFMTLHFGVDAGPLAAALRRYATDAGARRELLPKVALPAPP